MTEQCQNRYRHSHWVNVNFISYDDYPDLDSALLAVKRELLCIEKYSEVWQRYFNEKYGLAVVAGKLCPVGRLLYNADKNRFDQMCFGIIDEEIERLRKKLDHAEPGSAAGTYFNQAVEVLDSNRKKRSKVKE